MIFYFCWAKARKKFLINGYVLKEPRITRINADFLNLLYKMAAQSGWAKAHKIYFSNCHGLTACAKAIAVAQAVAISLRTKTGFSRTIFTLILTLNLFCASAQEYKFKAIAEKFRDGKFDKSLKLAEDAIAKDNSEMLPHVYKALSIYQGKEIKKIVAKYPNLHTTALSILTEAKPKAKKSDSIPTTFLVSLNSIQLESYQLMARMIKKGNYTGAKPLVSDHYKLFDNSGLLFESYIFPNLSKLCNEQLLLKETKDKTELFNFIFDITQTYTNNILRSGNNIRNLYLLKKVQQTIMSNNALLTAKKGNEYVDKWNAFLLSKFDGSCEKLRNYYGYLLLFPKGEGLTNDNFVSSTLYKNHDGNMKNNLSKDYQFEEWNNAKYKMANTGKDADYLTKEEKTVLYVANLCRMDPVLFERTFLKKYLELHPDEKGTYASSLIATLKKGKTQEPILPDSILFLAAKIHAVNYGELGKEGHGGLYGDPTGRAKHFGYVGNGVGECCDYGMKLPEEMVIHLLVDKDVSDLGHRKAMTSTEYVAVGISIQPHKQYGVNAVLDFTE